MPSPNHLAPSAALSVFILALVASSLPSTSSRPCNSADMRALLRIKKSMGDPAELSSWDSARAADCCSSWTGVDCDDRGRVVSVGFSNSNASGPVPAALGDLPALRSISWFDLPNLSGPIPASLARLPSLGQLLVARTALSGAIPPFLCDVPTLFLIDLSGNRLSGGIPPCLMSRVNSSASPPILSLFNNRLTGPVPASFAKIDFGVIDVSRNRLSGDPSFLFGPRMSLVSEVGLSWNRFGFDLSPVRFPLTLSTIGLGHNRIWGRIPPQIGKLKWLMSLDVSHNMLCGPIPAMKGLSEMPAALFEGNTCLCGSPLPPCPRQSL